MSPQDVRYPVGPEARESSGCPLSRRAFLKGAAVAAGAAGAVAAPPAAAVAELAAPSTDELAEKHAGDFGVLIDLTKCVGCARCVRACKDDNDLEWRDDQPVRGPDAELSSSTWSVVRSTRVRTTEETPLGPRGRELTRYAKIQCMHCLEPACASACFVAALQKTEAGPVVYDPGRCIGCRYCMMACPFGVPSFDWDGALGRIEKCDMCLPRTSSGEVTACAEACPTGTITFGRRGALLEEAWRRIDSSTYYVRHVYGEREVGGTSVMYVSDVPFEKLGFLTTLPDVPLSEYTWRVTRLIPPVAVGVVATLATLYVRRRRYLEGEQEGGSPSVDEEVTV